MTSETPRFELTRGLTLAGGVAIVVGTVIGTGVFLKARAMACNVESPSMVLGVWIVAGVLSLGGALTYAELAAMMPRAGGEFVIMREAYGPRLAFMYGWMRCTVGIPGAQAAKAVAFAIFLDILTGGALSVRYFAFEVFGHQVVFGRQQIASLSIVVLITAINCASVSVGGRLATAIVAVKIAMIASIAIAAFAFGNGDLSHLSMSAAGGTCEGIAPEARGGWTGVGAAMLGALWAYDGWSYLASVAGEIDRPSRNIPLGLIGGTALVIVLYLAVNAGYVYVLSPVEIASVPAGASVATAVVHRLLGAPAAMLMAAGMLISVVGSLQTGILAGARTPYAIARDGVFFPRFAELSPKSRVPVNALLAQGVWIIVLTFSGSFDALTDYVMFADWIFYALITASVFVFRRRLPDMERPYRTLGYPVVPLLFIVTAGWLLASRVVSAPRESLIGVVLIGLGLPVYTALARTRREP